ncbi:MAG: alpha/beta fold hydrolase, partial [Dokdonella sp.]
MQTQKLQFPGHSGELLAARLDRPDAAPRAYALFAHCFTCSKDIAAASRISTALVERGFAVLRFDFTGLGMSEGEFANTNFSSNVADLVKAADYLRETHTAPTLLIGHSLGGAAVLAAASKIDE